MHRERDKFVELGKKIYQKIIALKPKKHGNSKNQLMFLQSIRDK